MVDEIYKEKKGKEEKVVHVAKIFLRTMERFQGQRPGTFRFAYENFIYYRDSRYHRNSNIISNEWRYICQHRNSEFRCPVTAIERSDGSVDVFGDHEHPENNIEEEIRLREMIFELKRMARESFLPPNAVYLEVSRRFRDITHLIRPEARCMHVIRERRRHRPPIPPTIHGLEEMLQRYVPVFPIFRAAVHGTDGSVAIIFASQTFINSLNEASELHMDGTFKCIPYYPRCSQLFIIHLRQRDIGIPAVFILCERRTTALYNAIWTKLIEMAPRLIINLQVAITDYERALIASLRQTFPLICIRGCWFHFTRAVTRKWRNLHLNNADTNILEMTWALPLLPANHFEDGLNVLRTEARRIENDFETIEIFMRYLERTWVPLKNYVSVRASSVRTNNIAENFNRQLVNKLGGPFPDLFNFIDKLIIVIEQQESVLEQIHSGTYLRQRRRNNQAVIDSYILQLQQDFDNNRLTIREFLTSMRNRNLKNKIEENNSRLNDENTRNPIDFPHIDDLEDPPRIQPYQDPLIIQPRRKYNRRTGGARRCYRHRNEDELNTSRSRISIVSHAGPSTSTYPGPSTSAYSGPSTSTYSGPSTSTHPDPSTSAYSGPSTSTYSGPFTSTHPDPSTSAYASAHTDDSNNDTESENTSSEVSIPEDVDIYGELDILNFSQDEEATEDNNVCCHCLINTAKIYLTPCQHACLCFRCKAGKDIMDSLRKQKKASFKPSCPICRTKIDGASILQ